MDLTTGSKEEATRKFIRADAPSFTALTELEARNIAQQRYPGCAFALSTLGHTHPGISLPLGAPDAVVVAVLHLFDPRDVELCQVVAYVISAAKSTACIPFSPEIWPDLRDLLPRDGRHPGGSRRRS